LLWLWYKGSCSHPLVADANRQLLLVLLLPLLQLVRPHHPHHLAGEVAILLLLLILPPLLMLAPLLTLLLSPSRQLLFSKELLGLEATFNPLSLPLNKLLFLL